MKKLISILVENIEDSENEVTDFIDEYLNEYFNTLNLVKIREENIEFYWYDVNGKKIFYRNHWGMFWIIDCIEFDNLKSMVEPLGVHNVVFTNILLNFLNNKYEEEFGKQPLQQLRNECNEYGEW